MSSTESTLAPEVLSTLHQRYAAGEKLPALAKEVGLTWQRLWVLMVTTAPKTEIPAAKSAAQVNPVSGRTHRQFNDLMALVAEGHPNIMLVGPAGTGKTTLVKHVATALGRAFAVLSLSAGVTETHIFGRMLPQADGTWAYQESPFIRIYRTGGVFLLDEVDAADGNVMVSINSALANGFLCNPVTGDQIERHPDTLIISAANTYGRGGDMVYVGRNALDGAALDRFCLSKLFVNYDTELEWVLCKSLPTAQADALFAWVKDLRKKIMASRLRRIASTRLVEQSVKAMKAGRTLEDVKARYFQDWSNDEKAKVGAEVAYA